MYAAGEYDLAGFSVGAVDRTRVLPRFEDQRAGDVLIGLASSGPHSNGYSLIRRVVERTGLGWEAAAPFGRSASLAEALMTPTRLYVRTLVPLFRDGRIKGGAHITGGGLIENPGRAVAPGLAPRLDWAAWSLPSVFDWLQREGGVADGELRRTFNCGVGFVLVVGSDDADATLAALAEAGEVAFVCGELATA
jgi:phosphoribosylformylglycinamidine cyclo-ligase/phosphoribosylamine--glycine ligase/phosphoribosylglycinamide formyltransferase/phosphoribosylformylglycinamidine cyclo-ligase